jgi:mRNA-degrading endonuclease HigB of HigAB toxin-antitoxin module
MILIGREHITTHSRRFPSAKTALAMWQAISQRATWTDQSAVISCFPAVKFLTPRMACFYPVAINCVITTQIAFNSGILIVLAVNEAQATQFQST